tara:strand:- start:277 stop:678 length:402 start_codon:yes stop_codon:yes gene_type:complete
MVFINLCVIYINKITILFFIFYIVPFFIVFNLFSGVSMPKGYFLSAHRSPANPQKREAYLQLAGSAMLKSGGTTLASTNKVEAHENGASEQTVLIEFESLEKAIAAYNSEDYQKALEALDGGADRDIRIFEGK